MLGITWLKQHKPHLDWQTGKILAWGITCSHTCLLQPQQSLKDPLEREELFPDISKVPEVYLDLKEVFNKARATSIPLIDPVTAQSIPLADVATLCQHQKGRST